MDFDAAMEHANTVGAEIVKLGLADGTVIQRFLPVYATYLQQGVEGTFLDLLVSRKLIDRGYHQVLDLQFPSSHLRSADSASSAPAAAPPPPPPRPQSGSHTTRRMHAVKLDESPPTPQQAQPRSPEPAPEDVQAWLECEPLDPLPICDFQSLALGRDKRCDMQLPHQGVSRMHAMITSAGGELTLEDRSTYGTFVNGEQVKSQVLEHGDVIAIGPYMIIVRDEDPRGERPDTLPFRIPGFAVESMHGKLTEVALSEVLQQIDFNAKTGTLRVITEHERGELAFEEGKPKWAKFGALRDDEAVFGMMALKQGEFSFMAAVDEDEPHTMKGTVTALLMEASRRLDEGAG